MSSPTSPTTPTTSSFVSADAVLTKLCNIPDIYYVGTSNLAASAEFRIGGLEGNQLIVKNADVIPTEFVMAGVFEIDRCDFYFTADANHDPGNQHNRKLSAAKATCHLLPMQHDSSFPFSSKHFPNAINNLCALEKLAPMPKNSEVFSSVTHVGGMLGIKLSHALFQKKEPVIKNDDEDEEMKSSALSVSTLESEIDTTMWPVQDKCKDELENLAKTHQVMPIPTYSTKNKLILPDQYKQRLSGAIVEAHFGLIHHYIKKLK